MILHKGKTDMLLIPKANVCVMFPRVCNVSKSKTLRVSSTVLKRHTNEVNGKCSVKNVRNIYTRVLYKMYSSIKIFMFCTVYKFIRYHQFVELYLKNFLETCSDITSLLKLFSNFHPSFSMNKTENTL